MSTDCTAATLPGRIRSRRFKIAVACERCRFSKKKCDGARPACNQCRKKRTPCSYRSGTPTSSLSSALRPNAAASPSSHASSPRVQPTRSDEAQSGDPPPGVIHRVFAGEVKAAIDARLGIPSSSSKKGIGLAPFTDAPLFDLVLGPQMGEAIDSVLPHRRHADHLVDMFWQHIQPLEPMLERGIFSRSYEALFAGRSPSDDGDERVFLCTLNTVFALATQLQETEQADERNRASNAYFCRAWVMLRVEAVLWEPGSVELVQCLLLMARYLQCSSNPHQTWMAVGIAVRMAQSIGLDKPHSAKNQNLDPVLRSFRQQLWQCCVYMDRMVSLVSGRAPMVLLPALSAMAPVPSHHASKQEGLEGDQTAVYLAKTMELFEISNHTSLTHMRIRSSVPDKMGYPPLYRFDEHVSNISRLDASLDVWGSELPPPLQYGHVDCRLNRNSYKQALLLQLRLLHGRITVLRPMLARYCFPRLPSSTNTNDTPDRGGLGARIIQDCAAVCVENAQKMIALIDECRAASDRGDNSDAGHGFVVSIIPWWYRVLYLHVAVTVLMAATLQPKLCTPAVSESWGRAMTALRAHEHLTPFVSQCLATLEALSALIGAQTQQPPPFTVPQPTAVGLSTSVNTNPAIPLQDLLLQDVIFDSADAFLFGMEDMSWMGSLGT